MALLLIAQISLIAVIIVAGGSAWRVVPVILQIVSIFVALHVINRGDNAPFRLMWVATILIFPLFGGALYIWSRGSTISLSKKLAVIDEKSRVLLHPYRDMVSLLPEKYLSAARYLQDSAGFPVYAGTQTEYLSPGERFFEDLLESLEEAEKYIFLEFFIIQHGKMWDEVLDILTRKAAQGVDVRIIYDDVGCFWRLPKDYAAELRSRGIRCHIFNPFRAMLSAVQNNRDHRKIVSVDGRIAYTGGVNLADEYINELELFGHWKDCAVKLEGEAAWSLTVIFLEMWRLIDRSPDDFASMRPSPDIALRWQDGFVQPYADSPMDSEHVGANAFLCLMQSAKRYIYINTPYLIVDDSIMNTLTLAAKSGVDVRIVTPHHADKPIVHATTRSYYHQLIQAGVRVYEYTKGFIHSKTVVTDDEAAIIGTTNFDYRSLYLHFECGVMLYGSRAVTELRDDFADTLKICHEMSERECRKGLIGSIWQSILRLFAPLM